MLVVLLSWVCAFVVNAETVEVKDDAGIQASVAKKFQAGVHYDLIDPAWKGSVEGPVVYEFFSYMCPGCNAFEPTMQRIEEQITESQSIIKIPVAFHKQWEPHAKAYYALKVMGHLDSVHQAYFAAIHQYKKPLRNLDDIGSWLSTAFAIDKQKFISTAESFAVDSQLRKGMKMYQAMGLGGVPSLVVNGRYKPNFEKLKTHDKIVAATLELLNQ